MRAAQGMPLARLKTGTKVRRLRDGRLIVDAVVSMPPEYVEQLLQGYRCIRCFFVQSRPFPEVCEEDDAVCRFPIAEKQLETFEKLFEGDVTPRPREGEYELAPLELTDEEWEQATLDAARSREFLWIPPEAEID